MNDAETSMLARARRGLTPTRGDAERVREALETALQLAATAAASTNATPDSMTAAKSAKTAMDGPSSRPKTAVTAPTAGRSLARWVRVGATLALATATGAAGYALGLNAGRTQTPPGRTATVSDPPLAPAASGHVEPPASLHPAPDPPAASPRSRTLKVEAPRTPAVPSAASPPVGESSLELETRLLARVERSLRDDNPRLALGLLGELEREVPGGQLEEERQAARVIAHCKLGSESAPKFAADFAARYASSAYRDRIRAACGGTADANGD